MSDKKPKNKKEDRYRNFCGVCYQEHIDNLREYLKEYADRGVIKAYYFILHQPESEDKQLHFHFLIEYFNAHTISSVYKKTHLPLGKLEVCTDVRSYACYLIHKYDVDKTRYYPNQVETNDPERYRFIVSTENANQFELDKLLSSKFFDLVENTNFSFYFIMKQLALDKDFKVKDLKRNAYLFKTTYDSFKEENFERKEGN